MTSLPKTYKKLVVRKMTTDFRAAVAIETTNMCNPQEGEICVRTRYVGINATDINIAKGRYYKDAKVPFDVGNEGIGDVVQVGGGVTDIKVGDVVAYVSAKRNAYAEYCCMPAMNALIVPEAKPEYLVLLISGLTAAIGLDKGCRVTNKETVLITAAAGGTGHIAVQWAKAADCHVIGTCSSADKEKVLKDLGCDRVINYKTEDLGEVLAKEYPSGIDVIWETIGGRVFETCVKNLAVKGRLLIVGGITGYKEEKKETLPKTEFSLLPETLRYRSSTIQGFLIGHYRECFPTYFQYLLDCVKSGKIRTIYDFGKNEQFTGLESIVNGVEYLHSGRSIGKVMAKIC